MGNKLFTLGMYMLLCNNTILSITGLHWFDDEKAFFYSYNSWVRHALFI